MDKTVKKKWIKALRSGKYNQGTGCLKDFENKTFCCLGVLCDIAGGRIIKNMQFPSETFVKKMQLSFKDMKLLADMNDEGSSFKVIANYIEKSNDI